jgi:hypothetical protein
MKNLYLNIIAATVAFGVTGCLEDMGANSNANAQNTNSTASQEYTPVVTDPATVNPVVDSSVTPDPINVDPVVPESNTPPVAPNTTVAEAQYFVSEGDIYMVQGGDTILVQQSAEVVDDETEDDVPDYLQLSDPLPAGEAVSTRIQLSDCKNEFWCGAKQDATIDAGFGPGEWFSYTDEPDGGDSYWTWPAEDWESIVGICNGICGVSTLGGAYMYPYMGFGFNLTKNEDAVDITDWGGICVTYSTDTQMRIALHPSEEVQAEMEYNDYRVALKPGKNVTKNFAWSDFKQDLGWGVEYDRNTLLTQVVFIGFVYQDMGAGAVSSFNISKIGKYGTCK